MSETCYDAAMSDPSPEPEVSIVIPVYNEAAMVRSAALELCDSLDGMGADYELILAENGSRDATAQICDELAEERPRVRALHLGEPNYGKALRRGIESARGRYVVCEEIDLCDLDFHARALALLRDEKAELVVGSKAARGASDRRPLVRRAGTKVVNGLLRVTLGFKGTDTHGLKAFLRKPLLPVAAACVVDKDMFASEFVVRAGRMGRQVVEIPIDVHEKRRPSINLTRRIPAVLKNIAKLVWVIRLGGR